ncbi:hypothetical protein AVEN_52082-1 [Araneus ventricosus]|uniref:Reverse transcriptase domain-containing protein n=1 Tax=Araneus ventricosus TaxID=182803 RepID=A0A4Y1ZWJ4_ARAVE|nr:hypothetical protein AVEN_52082-1 [Araneus ventricosus]
MALSLHTLPRNPINQQQTCRISLHIYRIIRQRSLEIRVLLSGGLGKSSYFGLIFCLNDLIIFIFSYTKYTIESVVIVKNFEHEILTNLHVSDLPESEKHNFGLMSVCVSILQNRKVSLLTPQGRTTKDRKQGCPQGPFSGPALLTLVANEILNHVWQDNVHIQAFADDFVLVIEADTNKSLVKDMQSEITYFSSWCSENELAISTDKTNYILFSKMARSPKITWNGYNINRVKSFKYLGIHVDDRLNWLEHINNQGHKAIKMQQNLKTIAGGNWGIFQIN